MTISRAAMAACILAITALTSCSGSRGAATSASGSPGAAPAAGAQQSAPPFLGRSYPSQGHDHLSPGTPDTFAYNSNPPTSGPHREQFTDTFISPVPLPKYVQVHLLEHGNVLLQYDCECPDLAAALGGIAMKYDVRLLPPNELQPSLQDVQTAEDQGFAVIVAPYPKMQSRIALTAWTRLATLPALDRQKTTSFIDAYLHNETNASQ